MHPAPIFSEMPYQRPEVANVETNAQALIDAWDQATTAEQQVAVIQQWDQQQVELQRELFEN